jgi:hypothetical protein
MVALMERCRSDRALVELIALARVSQYFAEMARSIAAPT